MIQIQVVQLGTRMGQSLFVKKDIQVALQVVDLRPFIITTLG